MDPIPIEEYPSLISLPYIAFQQEQVPAKRMMRMLTFFKSALRFVTLVSFCEFFRSEHAESTVVGGISRCIKRFDLREWLDVSIRILEIMQDRQNLYCRKLTSLFFRDGNEESEYMQVIREFLKLVEEARDKDFELILNQEILNHFETRLSLLIRGLSFFRDYKIVQIYQNGSQKKGYSLDFHLFQESGASAELVKPDLLDGHQEGRVYLKRHDSQEYLSLHPFLILYICDACSRPHLFFYDRIDDDGFGYNDPVEEHGQVLTDPRLFLRFGNLLARKKLYGAANGLYQEAQRLDPDSHEIKDLLFVTYKLLGTQYLFEKKYHLAIVNLRNALRINSDNVSLYLNLAKAYYQLKELDEALATLKTLLKYNAREAAAYALYGQIYEERDEPHKAVQYYNRCLEIDAGNKEIILRRDICTRQVRETEFKQKYAKSAKGEQDSQLELGTFLIDLTKQAREEKLQSIIGRDDEIAAVVEILSCQEKNNPIVIGEPGVGKTALVRELANRIVQGAVPRNLLNRRILQINVAALLAGTKYRGQFEQRMLDLLKALKQLNNAIIFIDDLQTIIHTGGSKGGGLDVANILKPALSEGEIQCIGASTLDDYRLYVEKDPTFERRFQTVKLEEPSDKETFEILQGVKHRLESHHQVKFLDEAIWAAILLPRLYLRDRFLPDKAIDILDRTGARTSLKHVSESVDTGNGDVPDYSVSKEDVMEVVSDLSGVPLMQAATAKREHFANMESILMRRIIGQNEAVTTVANVLRTTKLGFQTKPYRPDGILLFIGPTGVGKTELARALAEFLFGSEERLVRIDMSEFVDQISSSKLIGISPGYIGYHDRNQLADEIRNHPYSLILLDEIEKANSQVLNLFLQVFDAGKLTDGKGRAVYFGNTTIVMTSNIGGEHYFRSRVGYETGSLDSKAFHNDEVTKNVLMREIKRYLSPEFINRIDEIVFFKTLVPDDVKQIAMLNLKTIIDKLQQSGRELVLEPSAMDIIIREGYSREFGARNLDRVIRRKLLDPLAHRFLLPEWQEVTRVRVFGQDDDIVIELE